MKSLSLYSSIRSRENLPLLLITLFLTLISYRFVYNTGIYATSEWRQWRMERQDQVLAGKSVYPYQFRLLKPTAGYLIQKIISPVVKNPESRHLISYQIIIFFVFLFLYISFSSLLKIFYSNNITIIGLLLLQAVIPLSFFENFWGEEDFINLLFFSLGLLLMFKNRDYFLPLIFLLGTFNREQIIFLNVFYAIFLYSRQKLFTKKGIALLSLNLIAFLLGFLGLKFYFGFDTGPYTIAFNTGVNMAHWGSFLRLWIEEVLIFVIMCLMAYKMSMQFFKFSFISLILYVVLFFLNGIMGELAKFLPAYLILIPMGLQIFNPFAENPDKKEFEQIKGNLNPG